MLLFDRLKHMMCFCLFAMNVSRKRSPQIAIILLLKIIFAAANYASGQAAASRISDAETRSSRIIHLLNILSVALCTQYFLTHFDTLLVLSLFEKINPTPSNVSVDYYRRHGICLF